MNDITRQDYVMDSLEIAKQTWKRHNNVLRDIRKMFKDLEIAKESQLKYEFAEQSQTWDMIRYKLPRDLLITLISGYSTKLRKAIVDRWLQLEDKNNIMQIYCPNTFTLETNEILYNNDLHKWN